MSDEFKLPEPGSVDAPKSEDVAPRPVKERKPAAPRASSLERRLTEFYVSIGTMVLPFDTTCGTAVVSAAPETAAALDNLAKENASVKRALEKMLAGGAWGGVVMAHFPIITTILAHHNLLPPEVAGMMGVTPKVKPTLHAVEPTENGGERVGSGTHPSYS